MLSPMERDLHETFGEFDLLHLMRQDRMMLMEQDKSMLAVIFLKGLKERDITETTMKILEHNGFNVRKGQQENDDGTIG